MSKRFVLSSAFLSVAVFALIAMTAAPALAVKEFRDAFKSKYVKSDSTAANDVALAAAVEQTSCGICHSDPKNKKIRNDYGKQLAKLIKKTDRRTRTRSTRQWILLPRCIASRTTRLRRRSAIKSPAASCGRRKINYALGTALGEAASCLFPDAAGSRISGLTLRGASVRQSADRSTRSRRSCGRACTLMPACGRPRPSAGECRRP